MVEGCQRVGNSEELFYGDKDVLKNLKKLSCMLGRLYGAIH